MQYWGTKHTPQPSKFMDDLNKITRELSEMQEIFASESVKNSIKIEYHELGHSVDAGVEFIIKEMNGNTYLISVNSDKNPVKVTFSGLDEFKKINVLKENRNIKIKNKEFTDEYKPFGVHIYELN